MNDAVMKVIKSCRDNSQVIIDIIRRTCCFLKGNVYSDKQMAKL